MPRLCCKAWLICRNSLLICWVIACIEANAELTEEDSRQAEPSKVYDTASCAPGVAVALLVLRRPDWPGQALSRVQVPLEEDRSTPVLPCTLEVQPSDSISGVKGTLLSHAAFKEIYKQVCT